MDSLFGPMARIEPPHINRVSEVVVLWVAVGGGWGGGRCRGLLWFPYIWRARVLTDVYYVQTTPRVITCQGELGGGGEGGRVVVV